MKEDLKKNSTQNSQRKIIMNDGRIIAAPETCDACGEAYFDTKPSSVFYHVRRKCEITRKKRGTSECPRLIAVQPDSIGKHFLISIGDQFYSCKASNTNIKLSDKNISAFALACTRQGSNRIDFYF